jgi:hypothetical protein
MEKLQFTPGILAPEGKRVLNWVRRRLEKLERGAIMRDQTTRDGAAGVDHGHGDCRGGEGAVVDDALGGRWGWVLEGASEK